MKKILPLVALAGCLTVMLSACTSSETPTPEATTAAVPTILSPEEAPSGTLGEALDFELPTLAGDTLRLADLRGDIVVLNFWATWCAPCIQEIPELIALYNELRPHGFSVIGIAIDEEGEELVAPFAHSFGITYPVALDIDGVIADAYGGVWALPTTYVIDGEGQIMQRVVGLFPVEEMRPRFYEMLGLAPLSTTAN